MRQEEEEDWYMSRVLSGIVDVRPGNQCPYQPHSPKPFREEELGGTKLDGLS